MIAAPADRRRSLVHALLAFGFAGLTAAFLPAAPAPAAGSTPQAPFAATAPSFSQTKELTRVFAETDGSSYSFPTNSVTVTADQTENLRGRQRILISWTGAQPSGGRASNPYGELGLQQEYPVVILQCRGTDDPSAPADQRLRPETCFTGSVAERSQITRGDSEAAWVRDLDASEADAQRVSGQTPFPTAEVCPTADIDPFFTRLTPFVSAKGEVFPACDADHMPPEAAIGAAFPPNEIAAFSDASGAGSTQFEVRSDVENESLGCNDTVACSVVVVPINGLSCAPPSGKDGGLTTADEACRKGGRFLPGSSNFANDGVDQSVSPSLWWSASNWKNRFAIPITFGLPPDTCDVLDSRAPTGFYGSELLAQAALQWSPAYCLDQKRFKFQLNQMSDDAGFTLMESGGGPAAIVSGPHERRGEAPVGYAPTAVTGFAVGYVIDRPDNAGEFTDLRLNARLIAKLLTQSYLGSDLGRSHPGIGENPLGIMNDPEFQKLNPGLSVTSQEAGATVLSLSNSSDIITQLTDYIAHDKAAMAFINGEPDEFGMTVNPAYKKIELPVATFPLLDTFVPSTENVCRNENPAVYFTQLAAPVTTLRKISEALLDGWPNVQSRCDFDQSTKLYKLGRVDRQSFGSRFVLGVVSLGDADRYGLRAASLETKPGTYVAPTDASLAAAVALSEQKKDYQPFTLDQTDVRKSQVAYPGTMTVYTAAKLRDLDAADAEKVAQFIRISTTEGQRAGTGNGQLPGGYLPITRTGPTKSLFAAAQVTAEAIKAQTPAREPDPEPTEEESEPTKPTKPGPSVGGVAPVSAPGSDDVVTDVGPEEAPKAVPAAQAAPPAPVVMPETAAVSSTVGRRLLPTLLILGFLGVGVANAVRFGRYDRVRAGPR